MQKKCQMVSYFILTLLLLTFIPNLFAEELPKASDSQVMLKRIALFPFTNFTQTRNAGISITDAIRKEMQKRIFCRVRQ